MIAVAGRGSLAGLRPMLALSGAGLRGFARDRAALGWTLAFPAALLVLFAALSGGSGGGSGGSGGAGGASLALLVPGVLAMGLLQLGLYSAVSLVQQRERGVLKSLATAPIDRWTVVGGFVLGRLVVALVQTVILMGAARAIAGTDLATLPAVLPVVALMSATFIALGFAIAGLAKTEEMATQITGLASLPMLFLSGLFVPVEALPDVLRGVAAVLPLTYATDALRQVMVGAASPTPVWLAGLALLAWLGVALVVAVRRFRWQ